MIIWINGAYGSGKSTTAKQLQTQISNAFLLDAEAVGNAVRDNMEPLDYHVEFPDYAIWRKFVVKLALEMAKHTDGCILIPMTVLEESYMQEMRLVFEEKEQVFYHFILDVDDKQIGERILLRGEQPDCWCYEQIARCVDLLPKLSGTRIDGRRPVGEVAAEILMHLCPKGEEQTQKAD